MKIALLNEFSQASKNGIVLQQLKDVVEPLGYSVYNTGMSTPLSNEDVPASYTPQNPRLTYIHLGIQACLLINSKAVDFIVTGCGTGQGALMSLNAYPNVVCGYCIEPTDAYLFLQINNGNALSIPFAKGFGWGAELNIKTIFEKAFGSPKGNGYPTERKETQNRNAALLNDVKLAVAKSPLDGLKCLDQQLVKDALTPAFLEVFNANSQDETLNQYVASIVGK